MIRDFKVIEAVLHTGDTTVSITNSYINNNSVIEIYTDNYLVFPTNIVQSGQTLTITFDKQIFDTNVKVVINNIEDVLNVPEKISDLSDYDTSVTPQTGYGLYWNGVKWQPGMMYEEYDNLINRPKINNVVLAGGNNSAESLGLATSEDIDEIDNDISDIDAELLDIQSNKQDKLTAGTNITIVDNVISATGGSGGVDYSTTEQDTGKKWIDGKKIYCRTYELNNITISGGGAWNNVGISANDKSTIINGRLFRGGTQLIPVKFGIVGTQGNMYVGIESMQSEITYVNAIYIEYTKVGE